MPAPGWLRWTLAVAMVAVALYHLSRLVGVRWRRARGRDAAVQVDLELTHAAMGSAMAVMVLDVLAPAGLRSLGVVFAATMLWFASRAVRSCALDGPLSADLSARQVIGCAAMAYMLLVLAAPSARSAVGGNMSHMMTGAMSGMSMSGGGGSVLNTLSSPVLRAIAASATVAVAGWTVVRMRVRSANAGPALSLGCQLAVSATTVYMLAAM